MIGYLWTKYEGFQIPKHVPIFFPVVPGEILS